MEAQVIVSTKLLNAEYKSTSLVWDSESINSTELLKLSAEVCGWKKSFTYAAHKKLCDRRIFRSKNATLTSLSKREDIARFESNAGSLLSLPMKRNGLVTASPLALSESDMKARTRTC